MDKDTPTSTDAKLDEILVHLRNMDSRDRRRMIGSTIKSIITLIPLILVLWSTWYFTFHWKEIMQEMTKMAASSAANYTQEQSKGLLDQFLDEYAPKK